MWLCLVVVSADEDPRVDTFWLQFQTCYGLCSIIVPIKKCDTSTCSFASTATDPVCCGMNNGSNPGLDKVFIALYHFSTMIIITVC